MTDNFRRTSSRLKILIFSVMIFGHFEPSVTFAACSPKSKEAGKIIRTEHQPVSGYIYGFSEFTYKGEWIGTTVYKTGESIIHEGLFWVSNQDNSSQPPSTSSTFWSQIDARKYKGHSLEVNCSVNDFGFVRTSDFRKTSAAKETNNEIKVSSSCEGSYYSNLEGWPGSFERGVYNSDCQTGSGSFFSIIFDPEMTEPIEYTNDDCYRSCGYLDEDDFSYSETESDSVLPIRTFNLKRFFIDRGDGPETVAFQSEIQTLSNLESGKSAINAKVPSLKDSEQWVEASEAVASMGNWEDKGLKFSYSGKILRCSIKFDCLPKEPKLEAVYRVWPINGNEHSDGKEERGLIYPQDDEIEENEDGTKTAKIVVIPKDGYNKRLTEVRNLSCSGDADHGADVGSVVWWASLGSGSRGEELGTLRLEEPTLSAWSATPKHLKYEDEESHDQGVEIMRNADGSLRQIKTVGTLADIVVLDAYSYEIRFYSAEDLELQEETVSAGDPLDPNFVELQTPTGLYVTEAFPFSVWKIENPDGASAHNRLRISHIAGLGNEDYLFEEGSNGFWKLARGGGMQNEERTETELTNGDINVIHVIKSSSNIVSSKVKTVSRPFGFGERIIERVEDPDGAALRTAWDYYSNKSVDGKAYGRLKQVEYPDGSWERYEYDGEGREAKVVGTWLDGGISTSESGSRVVSKAYSVINGETTIMIVEQIAGTEVSRRYWKKSADGREIANIICTIPGAAVNASSNLVTFTKSINVGDFRGEIESLSHSDGTLTTYSYNKDDVTGSLTTTMRNGARNGSNVVSGREVVTIEDLKGQLISRTEKDIVSGIVVESYIVSDRDEQGRATLISYSDGTTEEKSYSCCGVETEKDRNGSTTSYTYDGLQRVLTETRGGITTLYSYDASGRVLKRTRRGSGGSGDIDTEILTYDLAGRVTSRKDALNNTTTYSETINGNGQKVRTTTLPNSSTQVEVTHRDGQTREINGSASYPIKYEYGTATGGQSFNKEIRIGEGNSESEWIKTYRDIAGRTTKVEYPGEVQETSHYNNLGQLVKQVDLDGIARLYAYNSEGEQIETAIDVDANGSISAGDRRTKTVRNVVSGPLIRTTTQQGETSGYVTVSVTDVSPNGLYQKETRFGLDAATETIYDGSGGSTVTTAYPDGSSTVTESVQGRVVSSIQKANGGAIIASMSQEYDGHGRLKKQIDNRVGTEAVYTYDDADRPTLINIGGMTTSYSYNSLGQVITQTLPGNRTITHTYQPTGDVLTEGGSATYPITYTYDPQGRRRTMTTSSGVTTWTYDSARGWLTSKADAQNKATIYSYTPAGRLQTRTWARGVVTTYGYNGAGELSSVSYSDGTPGATFTRDSQGRPSQIIDASGARSLTYTLAGQAEAESISGGILNGVSLSATYDGLLRRSSFTAARNSAPLAVSSFIYDGVSRLATVSSGDQAAVYNYLTGSSFVSQIAFKQNGTTAMTTTKSYDGLNRLSLISSTPTVGNPVSYAYQYNAAGQREQITLANSDTWNYAYNNRGEVISGGKKQGGVANLLGYQFSYAFDDLGNRTNADRNGRTGVYSANSLNQYTSRIVPGYIDLIGTAKVGTTVTVNDQSATRQEEAYHKELSVDNSMTPVYQATTVKGNLGSDTAEVTGKIFVPQTPEAFSYDADGNLLADGRWTYQWDGESRLIGMETQNSAQAAGAPKQRLTFNYDCQGRRISKKLEDWRGGHYQERFTMLFLYDGWNLVAEVLQTGPKIRTYVWGSDMSGGTRAGGVGGLLFVRQYPENRIYSVGYDANGNVMALFDMAGGGEIAASYEYGPFGEPLRVNGVMALIIPIQFSTKYTDYETGLVYYGHRYYAPQVGRWVNRDPIGESGGSNLYSFSENDPIHLVDLLGLDPADFTSPIWHHRIAKKYESFFRSFGVNVNEARWGWILEETDHRTLNNIYDRAWADFVTRNSGKEITIEMVEAELKVIETRFKSVLSRGEQAVVSYSQWGRFRPKIMLAKRTMGFMAKMKPAAKIAAKTTVRALVVITVIQAYNTAIAHGATEYEALNQASAEVINITPWSIDEMVRTYRNNSDWEYILKQSMDAHTRGNNLFDGFSDPESTSSRSYFMREILSGCGDE